jgi:sugar phosphate isomerase/epimerase
MKIGYSATLDQADLVAEAGYDFIEPKLFAFGLADRASLDAAKQQLARSPLPTLAFGSFFPRHLRLVGPDVDPVGIKEYLARAAELTSSAGALVAVMGSAWARNVPDGFARDRAEAQLVEAYGWAADAFEGSGVMLAIEPQNRTEANIILSVEEGVEFAHRVDRPGLKVIADFWHLDQEREPLDHLRTYAEWIVYVQVADTDRKRPGSGSYDYDAFFGHLRDGGYTGNVSVEIAGDIPVAEMRRSREFLRRYAG